MKRQILKMKDKTKYLCKCEDPGSCTIIKDSATKCCGIYGLVDFTNIKVSSKKRSVVCLCCKNAIYTEKREGGK